MEASICASFDRLRPNEELKPYYGEQPHKVIINSILSLNNLFQVGLVTLKSSSILVVKHITLVIMYMLSTHIKP